MKNSKERPIYEDIEFNDEPPQGRDQSELTGILTAAVIIGVSLLGIAGISVAVYRWFNQ